MFCTIFVCFSLFLSELREAIMFNCVLLISRLICNLNGSKIMLHSGFGIFNVKNKLGSEISSTGNCSKFGCL